MKRKIPIFTTVVLMLITSALSFLVFSLTFRQSKAVAKVSELEQILNKYFVDEFDPELLADAAVNAMIAATGDRWSYYVPAEEYAAYEESVENIYLGVGISVLKDESSQAFVITNLVLDGPAAKAGIKKSDLLIAVDGNSVVGMEGAQVRELILGEAGTAVTLRIMQDGVERDIAVTRAYIQNQVATCKMVEGNIGYIKLTDFNASSCEQTLACVEQVLMQGAEGVVFDIRFNPGGKRTELVALLDKLLPEGVLFRSVDFSGAELTDRSDAVCLDIPMAVLINEYSYSAAEFFAAALQEYEWAIIVGEKTVGKGNYQVPFRMQDGSAVVLSVGKYYTPQGKSLTDTGVTPDIAVSLSEEEKAALYYEQLDAASDSQLLSAVNAVKEMLPAEKS